MIRASACAAATSDAYAIEGPAVVSFSGGRTSAYMLRRMLDVGLDRDVHVLFADTGKERPETYEFIRECAARWGVHVVWVERPGQFVQLITDRKFLPNPTIRFCTQELKIRPMKQWMRAHGYEHWTNVVGIRADEPRRVARMRAYNDAPTDRWDVALPLADAGVTLAEVDAFWRSQSFGLHLRPWEGNCDLCFLKGQGKRRRIMEDRPDLAEWWVEQERRMGARFRNDAPGYAELLAGVTAQGRLPFACPAPTGDEDLSDCLCGD